MKATVLLRKDHELMRSLVAKLRSGPRGTDSAPLIEEVRREVLLHLEIEEELFYAELRSAPAVDVGVVDKAIAQHQEITRALKEVVSAGDAKDLIEKIEKHFEFEEEVLLEQAREFLTEYRLEELGLEMEERRRLLRLTAA